MKRLLALLLLAVAQPASAEVEKLGRPCESGICLYWWPRLPPVEGWHCDAGASERYGANALAPDGSTFMDAETVMYAKAIYRPRVPDVKSLENLMKNDKRDFAASVPGVSITDVDPIATTAHGSWERVSYGEEGDFYLIFTVSSRTESSYEKSLPAYEAMIHGYIEEP